MIVKAIQSRSFISNSLSTISSETYKNRLAQGLSLIMTYGISATLPSPAYGASFTGFGCSDNFACQSYLEFSNVSAIVGTSIGSSESWSLPSQRVSSPILFNSQVPAGPQQSLSVSSSQTFKNPNFINGVVVNTIIGEVSAGASASLDTILGLGQLKASAIASTNASATAFIDNFGVSGIAQGSAQAHLGWGDTITVTSNSYLPGKLIPFEVRLALDRIVSASGDYGGNSQSIVSAGLSGTYIPALNILDSNFNRSNVTEVTTIAYIPVGELFTIKGDLRVSASATAAASSPNQPIDIDISIADAFNTANYYLTPLVDDVGYTSGSGRTYLYSSNSTAVPEPFTIIGTFIGITAAFRLRKKLKASAF